MQTYLYDTILFFEENAKSPILRIVPKKVCASHHKIKVKLVPIERVIFGLPLTKKQLPRCPERYLRRFYAHTKKEKPYKENLIREENAIPTTAKLSRLY